MGQCCVPNTQLQGGREYSRASKCAEVGVWSRIQGGRAQCWVWGVCGPIAEGQSSREMLLVLSRLRGMGVIQLGASSAVSQASTSPNCGGKLCFSRVLVNGCSSVPPVKYNLLKGFGALIRTQRVVPFITMAMARPRARGGPVCENE